MQNRLEGVRAGLALVTAGVLVLSMFLLYTNAPALATHIPDTGPVSSHCVEFQGGTEKATGAKTPADFSNVTITLDSWDDLDSNGEPHGFTFTVSGLTTAQWVEASVKSGTDVDELGPFGNGQHVVDGTSDHAISHVRFCVFEDTTTTTEATTTTTEATTTTTEATTTTTEESTTTTEESTTTTEATTTTTLADTTEETTTTQATTTTIIDDEVLGTVITTTTEAPTTTVEDEVLDTEVTASTLPFTGVESEHLAMLALALLGGGLLVVVGANSMARAHKE